MIIKARNMDEYICCLTGLCGVYTFRRRNLFDNGSAYSYKRIGRLVKDNVIEKIVIDKGKAYKIITPEERDMFKDIPVMLTHLLRQTDGGHIKLQPDRVARYDYNTCVFMSMHHLGIPVDEINIVRDTLSYSERRGPAADRHPVSENARLESLIMYDGSYREILDEADIRKLHFFSSRIVKRVRTAELKEKRAADTTVRIAKSSMIGHLIGKGISFPVYMTKPGARQLTGSFEQEMVNYIYRRDADKYGRDFASERERKYPKGNVMMFVEDEYAVRLMLLNEINERKDCARPAKVFSACHIIPVTDNGIYTAGLLIEKGFSERLLSKIFYPEELNRGKEAGYGISAIGEKEGDIPVFYYDFTTMDIRKIAYIRNLFEGMQTAIEYMRENDEEYIPAKDEENLKICVICLLWQKHILKEAIECIAEKYDDVALRRLEFIVPSEDIIRNSFEEGSKNDGNGN